MLRIFIITISILYACTALAKGNYQIDVILFAHPQNANKSSALELNSPLLPVSKNVIRLKAAQGKSLKPYTLLSLSQSSLRDEYYLLSRKSHYQVLGHFSWIQSTANQDAIALPNIETKGWQVQGTLRVRESNFYTLDADLQGTPPSHPESSFTITQRQRLKGGMVYYIDHAQIGMIVKINKAGAKA